jgi:hypothetical protein
VFAQCDIEDHYKGAYWSSYTSGRQSDSSGTNDVYSREKYLRGVVVLEEVLHEIHKTNVQGIILKLDFEKACDKVQWVFFCVKHFG